MARIEVDGRTYEVDERSNLLEACLSEGIDLPYFCWHPALGSVGACRQCAVVQYQNEEDTRGRLTMACMTPAADGTRISVDASPRRSSAPRSSSGSCSTTHTTVPFARKAVNATSRT